MDRVLRRTSTSTTIAVDSTRGGTTRVLERTKRGTSGVQRRERRRSETGIGDCRRQATSTTSVGGHATILTTGRRLVKGIVTSTYSHIGGLSRRGCFKVLGGVTRGCLLPERKRVYFSGGSLRHVPTNFHRRVGDLTRGGNNILRVSNRAQGVSKNFVLVCNNVRRGYSVSTVFTRGQSRLLSRMEGVLFTWGAVTGEET